MGRPYLELMDVEWQTNKRREPSVSQINMVLMTLVE